MTATRVTFRVSSNGSLEATTAREPDAFHGLLPRIENRCRLNEVAEARHPSAKPSDPLIGQRIPTSGRPNDAAIQLRSIFCRNLIKDIGLFAQHAETVSKAYRDISSRHPRGEYLSHPSGIRREPRRISTATSKISPRKTVTSLA